MKRYRVSIYDKGLILQIEAHVSVISRLGFGRVLDDSCFWFVCDTESRVEAVILALDCYRTSAAQ